MTCELKRYYIYVKLANRQSFTACNALYQYSAYPVRACYFADYHSYVEASFEEWNQEQPSPGLGYVKTTVDFESGSCAEISFEDIAIVANSR